MKSIFFNIPHSHGAEIYTKYLMSFTESKSHSSGVLHSLTYQGIPTGKDQGLLDGGRIISDDIHYQLDVLWFANFSERYG